MKNMKVIALNVLMDIEFLLIGQKEDAYTAIILGTIIINSLNFFEVQNVQNQMIKQNA